MEKYQLWCRWFPTILLVIGTVVVWHLWTLKVFNDTLALKFLGSFLGISFGLLHVPRGRHVAPPRPIVRKILASVMVIVTLYVLTAPWHITHSWPKSKEINNVVAVIVVTPVAVICAYKPHPPSGYVRDAVWSVFGLWLILVMLDLLHTAKHPEFPNGKKVKDFLGGVSLHMEGVVFAWNASLMARRLSILETSTSGSNSFGAKYSRELIALMGVAFHMKMWTEVTADFLWGWWKYVLYLSFATAFLGIWCFYTGLIARCLGRSALLLWRESRCVRGAPQAEAKWACKVLSFELTMCMAIGCTTAAMWTTMVPYRLLQWSGHPKAALDMIWLLMVLHRADLIINGISVALLSGLLWQAKEPSAAEMVRRRPSARSSDIAHIMSALSSNGVQADEAAPCAEVVCEEVTRWSRTVEDLAGRGFTLTSLLDFWELLTDKRIMPCFDPHRSLTNDVVRLAVIPLSKNKGDLNGGRSLASVWSHGQPIEPQCMVTHNWGNLFLHLVAAILADALELETYVEIANRLVQGHGAVEELREELADMDVLDRAYWVCAFSINQHAGICGGFGAPPPVDTPDYAEWEAKRKDTVTKEIFPLCQCNQPKIFNDQPAMCELNKFDDMMRLLAERIDGFVHLIVVDANFEVFSRAWCIAEVVESDISGIPQRIKIHSQEVLDLHYDSLAEIDVRDCRASRPEDREMILSNIGDITTFNVQLQWAIFGTKGLFSKWCDGQERAALIGRIVKRARSAEEGATVPYAARSRLRKVSGDSLASSQDSMLHTKSQSSTSDTEDTQDTNGCCFSDSDQV